MPQRVVPYTCTEEKSHQTHGNDKEEIVQDNVYIDLTMQQVPIKFHLSFCGCGFLGIYHLGAATSLIKNRAGLLRRVDRVVGASAGALVASALVIHQDKLKDCIAFTHNLAEELRSKPAGALTPGYNLMKPLKRFLHASLPEDAHVRASGRLYISLTNMKTRKNEIFSQYENRDELIKCLLASSYIPLYGGVRPPKIRGKRYLDGGFTNNLPVFDEGFTVRVSPFCGGQEIAPKDKTGRGLFFNMQSQDFQVNLHNITRGLHAFFPPSKKTLDKYYNRGFQDAERYLKANNWYQKQQFDSTPKREIIIGKETSV